MAYLAGLEFPVNSVGELPLSYLAAGMEEKALAAMANAKEVLEMYTVKEAQKRSTVIRYRQYAPFANEKGSVHNRLSIIQSEIDGGKYEDAIAHCSELLDLAIQGLRYLQTYDWLFLRALVTLGYLGWIAFALTTVIDLHVLHGNSTADRTNTSVVVFSSLLVVLYSAMIVQKSPLTYYAYGAFPVFFWEEVFARKQALASGYRILFEKVRGVKGFSSFAIEVALFMLILQALVRSLLQILLPFMDVLLTRIRYNHTSIEQFSPYATF